jgi:hypothetical protein
MEINSPHLSFETITDLALDLKSDESSGLHFKSCPQCELESARVGSFVEIMRQDTTEEVPSSALTAVLRAFGERRTKSQPTTTRMQKLLAVLRFDSAQMTLSYGFRSVGAASSRQLLFAVGNGTLDLRITRSIDGWTISGQVLGEIFAGTVELSGTVELATELDDQSHFTLPSIPSGNYRLRLYSDNYEVEIPDLVIQ